MKSIFLMEKLSKIYIAGHKGLVGSAIMRILRAKGFENLLFATSSELDLRNQEATERFFNIQRPEYVFLAAARVGGIKANMSYPAQFAYDNLQIQNNVIHFSWKFGVKKLFFFGSNCIYPKDCRQPMQEGDLLTGAPEPTNEAYAVAKLAGIELCRAYRHQYGSNFITAITASQFGPNDNFSSESSHLVPALIRRFHEARISGKEKVTLWGSGTPRRELMHVDDLAEASIFLMYHYNSPDVINIGVGRNFTIQDISDLIKRVVRYTDIIDWDTTKPDGIPRKLLDSSRINLLGWRPNVSLEEGLKQTYEWFVKNIR